MTCMQKILSHIMIATPKLYMHAVFAYYAGIMPSYYAKNYAGSYTLTPVARLHGAPYSYSCITE